MVHETFCGIDWAEEHHDVAVVDRDGVVLARARISDDAAGYAQLLAVLTEHGDTAGSVTPVAIETGRGLLVAALRASGRPVFVINPMAAARYRERWTSARSKSDAVDAQLLANVLRTDAAMHRPLPVDTELVRALAVLARAGQEAVWARQQLANQLRSVLREFYPAALTAFQVKHIGLASREAIAVLTAAPTPTTASRLTRTQLRRLLARTGRQRNLDAWSERLLTIFAVEQLHHDQQVEAAFGAQVSALVLQLTAAATAADQLLAHTEVVFAQHPDAETITSFPGLGPITGARILAEIGDDRSRFTTAKALKAYAGSAPVTRASGKSKIVMYRRVKNNRLAATGYLWAFAALTKSPAARAHYDQRRARGDRHAAALRHLFNRMIGQLHHCLDKHTSYAEDKAFSSFQPSPQSAIAA
jgi:transposase